MTSRASSRAWEADRVFDMASATLRGTRPIGDTPDALMTEIARLYRALRALPGEDQPRTARGRRSPAYTALETEIRGLALRYGALTAPRILPR